MTRLRKSHRLLSSVATALVASVLWVFALAALPTLHEALHHDAGTPGHECAVTMFQHGSCDDAPQVQVAPELFPLQLSPIAELRSQGVSALFLLTCVLEHGPPLLS